LVAGGEVNHRGTEGTEDAQRLVFLCASSVPSVVNPTSFKLKDEETPGA
jgi:hypothetical protein